MLRVVEKLKLRLELTFYIYDHLVGKKATEHQVSYYSCLIRCPWLGNPGNYTHYTLRVLTMIRVVERNTKVKSGTHFLHSSSSGGNKGHWTSSFILQLPYYRCAWLVNPGNYTHCTLRVLTMLRVVERNTKVKIRTHFLHSRSSGGNKGNRTSSFILQLPY